MLTQFGKTWVDTGEIVGVTILDDGAFDVVFRNSGQVIVYSGNDPEGFKAYKEWLKFQSPGEAENRDRERHEFTMTKLHEAIQRA